MLLFFIHILIIWSFFVEPTRFDFNSSLYQRKCMEIGWEEDEDEFEVLKLEKILESEKGDCVKLPLLHCDNLVEHSFMSSYYPPFNSKTSPKEFDDYCVKNPDCNPIYTYGTRKFRPNGGYLLHIAAFKGNSKLVQHIITLSNSCINQGDLSGRTQGLFIKKI